MNRLHKAWRLSRGKRRLLLEACAELLRATGQLRCLPFRTLAPRLGTIALESSGGTVTAESARAQEVRWAVQAVARRLTGICTCLVMAMAAQKMLARRGLPYTLYPGVSQGKSSLAAVSVDRHGCWPWSAVRM